LSGDHIK